MSALCGAPVFAGEVPIRSPSGLFLFNGPGAGQMLPPGIVFDSPGMNCPFNHYHGPLPPPGGLTRPGPHCGWGTVGSFTGGSMINLNTPSGSLIDGDRGPSLMEFGGEVGGPIIKDRLWFWGSGNRNKIEQPGGSPSLARAEMAQWVVRSQMDETAITNYLNATGGIFSGIPDAPPGDPVVMYDQMSGRFVVQQDPGTPKQPPGQLLIPAFNPVPVRWGDYAETQPNVFQPFSVWGDNRPPLVTFRDGMFFDPRPIEIFPPVTPPVTNLLPFNNFVLIDVPGGNPLALGVPLDLPVFPKSPPEKPPISQDQFLRDQVLGMTPEQRQRALDEPLASQALKEMIKAFNAGQLSQGVAQTDALNAPPVLPFDRP